MDIGSAVAHLKNGKKVRRKTWDARVYYYLNGDDIMLHSDGARDVSYTVLPNFEVLANDWEVYEEPPKTETILCRNLRDNDVIISDGREFKIRYIHIGVKYEEIKEVVCLHPDREVERKVK